MDKDQLDDFVTHPVWVEIKARFKERIEALKNCMLDCPLDKVDPIRLEIKAMNTVLEAPQDLFDELEEMKEK